MTTTLRGRYLGQRAPLFRLYIVTALLTLVTVGIYRFWAKTRIRKYVWSAATGDNDSFEYTGTGLEKFLGFLVAIVVLAVYLGIVQMLLLFLGLNLVVEPETQGQAMAQIGAIYITLLAVLPLVLFAQYRARRYRMARSRWRGIRFGMDNGAWGYAGRAMVLYLLNILTIGLLTPLVTFRLEKYMADRSWYGDAPFEQNGRWQDLYGGMRHVFIGLGLVCLSVVLFASAAVAAPVAGVGLGVVSLLVGNIWLVIGVVAYRVFAFNYLTRNKVLDGTVRFEARVETRQIVRIVLIGSLVIGALMAVVFGAIGGIVNTASTAIMQGTVSPLVFVVIVALYGAAFLVAGGLSLVMITQPIVGHAVDTVRVHNADHLDTIHQRNADAGADAEGFADALDVGGAL